jgi:anti-sigma factor RsiW
MGGRVISTTHGPGFMLMYDDDKGSRLMMLSRPMVVDEDKPMVGHSEGSVGSWTWADNGMGFSLIGSGPAEFLHPIADEVRSQVRSSL